MPTDWGGFVWHSVMIALKQHAIIDVAQNLLLTENKEHVKLHFKAII